DWAEFRRITAVCIGWGVGGGVPGTDDFLRRRSRVDGGAGVFLVFSPELRKPWGLPILVREGTEALFPSRCGAICRQSVGAAQFDAHLIAGLRYPQPSSGGDAVNWEAIGAISEAFGAAGVVVSLIYLGVQIRQNTRSVQAATFQSVSEA